MKKISIIIATYNAGATLNRCLDSIVPQLKESIELIIIDGLSKDNTTSIIQEYTSYISYTTSEQDKGVYDAWNKGIKVAKGEWIMFVGADDTLLPNAIKSYLELLSSNDYSSYDYICAQNEYTDSKGNMLLILGGEPCISSMKKRMNAAHVASLHNKVNLFDKYGLYSYQEFKICSDYELLLRKKDLKYIYINAKIAKMQIGGMSLSIAAVFETYNIRKKHNTIGTLNNTLLLIKDIFSFYYFKQRYL